MTDARPPLPPRRCRFYHGVPGCRCQVSGIAGKPHTGLHHCEEHDFSWSDVPTPNDPRIDPLAAALGVNGIAVENVSSIGTADQWVLDRVLAAAILDTLPDWTLVAREDALAAAADKHEVEIARWRAALEAERSEHDACAGTVGHSLDCPRDAASTYPWMKPSSGVFDLRGDAVPEATSDGRRPEDDAECERLGCEDRTHPVHHRAALARLDGAS